jgi:UDP-2-acetamido-3-amino-2,3-dideoxy-glucuronate N-acetyltransferase
MSTSVAAAGQDVFIHPQALVESDSIGQGTRIWAFAHVMQGARIGAGCNIGDHAFIESGAIVGNRVTVKNGVAIWDCVTIEDGVFLGPHCVLTNDLNPRANIRKSRTELIPTRIGANATVGANATIVCGVTVGRGAFIGAGTVVVRSIPDFALMVGNPARQTGWMCACGKKLQLPVAGPKGLSVTCRTCSREFTVAAEGLAPAGNGVAAHTEAR